MSLQVVSPEGQGGPHPGTLDAIYARYRAHLAERVRVDNYTPRSFKRTTSYAERFLSFVYSEPGAAPVRIGSLPIKQARQKHLKAWLIANFDRWKKGSTRADALGSVLGCFNWWAEEEDETPPFRHPRKMRFPRTHFRAMKKAHYRAIMREARKHPGSMAFRLALFFAWHTGSRLTEMRLLEFDHIDWEGVVRDLHNKTSHLTGEARMFGLGPHLLSVLRGLYERRRPGQKRVFLTPRGHSWTKDNLGRHFARYRELAGVPEIFKMAGTRHGWAVRLTISGENTKAIADQQGHKNTRMLESIYADETRQDAEHLRRIAAAGEKRSKPSKPKPEPQPQPPPPPPDTPLFDQLGD
jgi:integrase